MVELVVSLSAGLVVAMAAFLMARSSTTFFQHEARLTSAQFANMIGMTRLQADIRRAALQGTPNVQRDPKVCGFDSTWPDGLKELAGLRIENGGSVVRHNADHALSTLNGLSPDALIVGGMMSSTEHYSIAALEKTGGGGYDAYLELDGAYWRTKLANQSASAVLDRIFAVGRFVRVVDSEGRIAFGVVTGLDESGIKPRVSISGTPTLAKRETHSVCGCIGLCTGSLINPVSRVLYSVRTVDPATYPRYAGLFAQGGLPAGVESKFKGAPQAARTELVRVELDVNGAELDDTLEVVAEHVVDFKFGVTVTRPGTSPDFLPQIERHAIGDANVYTQAASLAGGGRPEHISAVQVRMSTRSPHPDRRVGLPGTGDGGLLRFNLGNNRGFARMRTLTSEVYLPNQAGVEW